MSAFDLQAHLRALWQAPDWRQIGYIRRVIGLTLEASGLNTGIGDVCLIEVDGKTRLPAEVVGFRDGRILMMPLGELTGIAPGARVIATGEPLRLRVGPGLVGRVINAVGEPIDGRGPIDMSDHWPTHGVAPAPMKRQLISMPLEVGVRAIDGLITCGKGQRMAIMAGSGVGKSTLLGMMSRNTSADVNCIALIGERGREVREFLEHDLGPEGLARSVVVVATGDEPPLLRIRGALVATAIAEYFRGRGQDVLLVMDSLTRFAMAQREVGLAIGEPPTTRGYTPSVFSMLPRLLERAGSDEHGTITGFYTVLVEGDDFTEPIADAVRSIVDGHVVLSRSLAERNHYPAIDVLASISRVMNQVTDERHQAAAGEVRRMLATYKDAEDLVNVGAYKSGTNPAIDRALASIEQINAFLRQGRHEPAPWAETMRSLAELAADDD
ncbi:MAG: FliI/YscN family ATPase [Limnochordia bacterium]